MEVSSIGLMMQRVGSIHFDVAAFTNFTQDHLDIHDSMEIYLDEKRKLFTHHIHSTSVSILVADQPETASTPVEHGRTMYISTTDRSLDTDTDCDGLGRKAVYSIEGSSSHFSYLITNEDTEVLCTTHR